MSSLPIACTLTASDLATVKERYRSAAGQYQATARINADHADVTLSGDRPTLRDLLAEMIERESACCPFLTFDVHETERGFDLRLSIIESGAATGLERGILRDMVATLFPAADLLTA